MQHDAAVQSSCLQPHPLDHAAFARQPHRKRAKGWWGEGGAKVRSNCLPQRGQALADHVQPGAGGRRREPVHRRNTRAVSSSGALTYLWSSNPSVRPTVLPQDHSLPAVSKQHVHTAARDSSLKICSPPAPGVRNQQQDALDHVGRQVRQGEALIALHVHVCAQYAFSESRQEA